MSLTKKLAGKYRVLGARLPSVEKAYEILKKDIEQVLKRTENPLSNVHTLLTHIEDLASMVYNEGEDYYAEDYISQKLDRKWKGFLREFQEGDHFEHVSIWDLYYDFEKLEKALQGIYSELKEEARNVTDPEKVKDIKMYFPEIYKPKVTLR